MFLSTRGMTLLWGHMKSIQFLHRNTEYLTSILCSTAFVRKLQLFYKLAPILYHLGRAQRDQRRLTLTLFGWFVNLDQQAPAVANPNPGLCSHHRIAVDSSVSGTLLSYFLSIEPSEQGDSSCGK